jgi:hypothetical protein
MDDMDAIVLAFFVIIGVIVGQAFIIEVLL